MEAGGGSGSAAPDPRVRRAVVEIFGEQFTLRGAADEVYMHQLARTLDERMRELAKKRPRFTPTQLAVLTALNVLDELTRLQSQHQRVLGSQAREWDRRRQEAPGAGGGAGGGGRARESAGGPGGPDGRGGARGETPSEEAPADGPRGARNARPWAGGRELSPQQAAGRGLLPVRVGGVDGGQGRPGAVRGEEPLRALVIRNGAAGRVDLGKDGRLSGSGVTSAPAVPDEPAGPGGGSAGRDGG